MSTRDPHAMEAWHPALGASRGSDSAGAAGKSTATARLSRSAAPIIFRVADPATAAALGSALGGALRDGNGVAAGAERAVDRAASGTGQALPGAVRGQFESCLDVDLTGVRIHTGGDSAAAAHAVGARAYTVGNDIHFAAGQYDPHSPAGQHLLAHEVAHTVQQGGLASRPQFKLEVSAPGDAAESEADRAADAMVRGERVSVSGGGSGVGRVAMRAADPNASQSPAPKVSTAQPAPPDSPQAKAAKQQGDTLLAGFHAKHATITGDIVSLAACGANLDLDLKSAQLEPLIAGAEAKKQELSDRLTADLPAAGKLLDDSRTQFEIADDRGNQGAVDIMRTLLDVNRRLFETFRPAAADRLLKARDRLAVVKANENKDPTVKGGSATPTPGGKLDGTQTVREKTDPDNPSDPANRSSTSVNASVEPGKLSTTGNTQWSKGNDTSYTENKGSLGVSVVPGGVNGTVSGSQKQVSDYDAKIAKEKEQYDLEKLRLKQEGKELEKKDFDKPKEKETSASLSGGYDPKLGINGSATYSYSKSQADGSKDALGLNASGNYNSTDGTGGGKLGLSNTQTDSKGTGVKHEGSLQGSKNADGTYSAGAGYNQSTTDANRNPVSGFSGSGQIVFDKNGKPIGFKPSFGMSKGARSVNLGGGYVAKVDAPLGVSPTGPWVVTYSKTYEGNASVGNGAKEKDGDGKVVDSGWNVSGSVSGGYSKAIQGSRSFADEASATAFYQKGAEEELGKVALPQTPEQALSMKEGEKVSMTEVVSYGGAASGGTMGFNIGGSVNRGSTGAVTFEKKQGGVVVVEVFQGNTLSGGVSGGGVGGSMGQSYNTSGGRTTRVEFDLSTDDGKRALASYQASGAVPASGCKVLSVTISDGHGSTTDASLLGVQWQHGHQVQNATTTDSNGNKIQESQGTESKSLSLPIPFVDARYDEKTSLKAVDVNGQQRFYAGEKQINNSSSEDAYKGLIGATGSAYDTRQRSGASSGKWKVESSFSDKQVDTFLQSVKSGEYKTIGRGTTQTGLTLDRGPGLELKKALAAAGNDRDAQRKALAEFVAAGGDTAVAQMREYGGASPDHHLTLTDAKGNIDKNFQGLPGRVALDGKIADLERQIGDSKADPRATAQAIRVCIVEQQQRIDALDPQFYPDLPSPVRAAEVGRSQGDIGRLRDLQKKLDERLLKENPNAKPTDPSRRVPDSMPQAAKDLGAAEEAMGTALTALDKSYQAVRKSRWVHLEGAGSFASSAKRDLGESMFFGLVDGPEQAAYGKADSLFQAGTLQRSMGQTSERSAAVVPVTSESEVQSAIALLRAATFSYKSAATCFDKAEAEYQAIRGRNPEKGYFGGYNDKLPAAT